MNILISTMELHAQVPIPSQEKTTDMVRGSKKRMIHECRPRQASTAAPVYKSQENLIAKNIQEITI